MRIHLIIEGKVNWHNYHYYLDVNPHWQRNQEFQRQWSINVWIGIVGSYYWSVFLWGESQRSKLFTFPSKWLIRLIETGWQSNSPHNVISTGRSTCTQIVKTYLSKRFPNRWIDIGSEIHEFPPRLIAWFNSLGFLLVELCQRYCLCRRTNDQRRHEKPNSRSVQEYYSSYIP